MIDGGQTEGFKAFDHVLRYVYVDTRVGVDFRDQDRLFGQSFLRIQCIDVDLM